MAEPHISRADILLWIDGELPPPRSHQVRQHIATCKTCHEQWRNLETTLDGYLSEHAKVWPSAGDSEPARDRLELTLLARTASHRAVSVQKMIYAGLCACLLIAAGSFLVWQATANPRETPISSLTPGLAMSVSRRDVCEPLTRDEPQIVTASMAQAVFAEYGIRNPEPRAYEVDYLVTPALGGARDIRNLWPQPYAGGPWTASVKDALEERLHSLVCNGDLDLAVAQRELSSDWVAAYRKYFGTEQPLTAHLSFRKDEPWE